MSQNHPHGHDHHHGQGAPHRHPAQNDDPPPTGHYQVMAVALRELLVEKGVLTADEVRAQIERMDARGPHLGARVVAKAWTDPAYKARLLADGPKACAELGIELDGMRLTVVEDKPTLHNMIVCTLCSCYPRALLGLPPAWYKSADYRKRAVREPLPWNCESMIPPPSCATSCYRCDPPAPKAGARRSSRRWSRATR
jgi:nitrile hydratase